MENNGTLLAGYEYAPFWIVLGVFSLLFLADVARVVAYKRQLATQRRQLSQGEAQG